MISLHKAPINSATNPFGENNYPLGTPPSSCAPTLQEVDNNSPFTALKLDTLARRLLQAIMQVGDFFRKRAFVGFQMAGADEEKFPYKDLFPPIIRRMNHRTDRCSYFSGKQPITTWFEHKLLSIINIPSNAVLFAVTGALGALGGVAFAAKVSLYVIAKIQVPVPLLFGQMGNSCLESGANVIRNSVEVVVDIGAIPFLLFKVFHS